MAKLASSIVYGDFHVTRDGTIGQDLTVSGNVSFSGQLSYGPSNTAAIRLENSTYSGNYLEIGGWSTSNSTGISRIRNSSGNLHIDSASNGNTYLNYYSGGTIYLSSSVILSAAGTGTTNAVRADRSIASGDGLSGGGNLTANRTLTVDSTVIRTTGNQTLGGTKTFSSAVVLSTAGTATTHAVRADRTITTGSGITGGGNLTANRTFAVDSTVIRTTGNQSMSGIKTFTGNVIVSDGSADGAIPLSTRFGRDGTQYTSFYGNASGNRLISVSSSGNPKDFQIRATDTVLTGTYTFGRNGTLTATTFAGALSGNAATVTNGVYTTGNQTIAGVKTFSSAVVLSTAGTATTHAVRADRAISTGAGLSGGGNLTANRTLTVDTTVIRTTGNQTLAGIKTFSSAVVLSTAGTATTHAVRADRTISTGAGITGGGNLTANRTFAVDATVFRANVGNTGNLAFASSSGRGVRFWNNESYKIYMASATDATWGGRLTANSDYNMYFKMANGTNRGFVFMNGGTPVAHIDAGGNGIFAGLVTTNSTSLNKGFKNTTISSAAPSGGANGDVWLQY